METERCPSCRGAKELMSLGMRMLPCKVCKGIGHVEVKVEPIVEVIKPKQKRVRKPMEDYRDEDIATILKDAIENGG